MKRTEWRMVVLDQDGVEVESATVMEEIEDGSRPLWFHLQEGWTLTIRAGSVGANVSLDTGPNRYGWVTSATPLEVER